MSLNTFIERLLANEKFMHYTTLIIKIVTYVYLFWAIYTLVLTILASAFAVYQEQKIWLDRSKKENKLKDDKSIPATTQNKTPAEKVPELPPFGLFKVFVFNAVWMILCSIGTILCMYKKMLTLGMADTERDAHLGVEKFCAKLLINTMIGNVKIVGKENLAEIQKGQTTPVYIANHASQIDIAVVYFIDEILPFKWIAKESTVFLPGVGSIMYLSKHIFINRNKKSKSRNSPANLFRQCAENIGNKQIPIFFFPQGTRQIQQTLPFKNGAFVVATENKAPLVPISLEIPSNVWQGKSLFSSSGEAPEIVITIHKPIPIKTGKEDLEELKKTTFDQIYSVLPDTWSLSSSPRRQEEEETKKDQ